MTHRQRLSALFFVALVTAASAAGGSSTRPAPASRPTQAAQPGDVVERPLRTSVLILTEGINGGAAGPRRHHVIAFSYDWNRERYRALEFSQPQRTSPPRYLACELNEDRFRALLDGVRDLGLAELPVEAPVASQDVYGRDIGLRFLHEDDGFWNRVTGGCVQQGSTVQPTEVQRERFDAVIAFIGRFADELPLQPATALDGSVAVIESNVLAAEYPRVVAELRADPHFAEVDFNRVQPLASGSNEFALALREWRHDVVGRPFTWPGYVLVSLQPGSTSRPSFSNEQYRPSPAVERERRATFVATHPELAPSIRDLIRAGWIEVGMTQDMVQAAWGEPESRSEASGIVRWDYGLHPGYRMGGQVTFAGGVVAVETNLARLRPYPGPCRQGP
jgi:hypothetical protein